MITKRRGIFIPLLFAHMVTDMNKKISTGLTTICHMCESGLATEYVEPRITVTKLGKWCKVYSIFFSCDSCLCNFCTGEQMDQNHKEYGYYHDALGQRNEAGYTGLLHS